MRIIFTNHAEIRIKKRKLFKEEVLDAINSPDKQIKKYDKYFIQKGLSRGTIEVCCEKTGTHIKVITIYWI